MGFQVYHKPLLQIWRRELGSSAGGLTARHGANDKKRLGAAADRFG
jgi:hypothetical protein